MDAKWILPYRVATQQKIHFSVRLPAQKPLGALIQFAVENDAIVLLVQQR